MRRDDPLATARGFVNALTFMVCVWLIVGGAALAVLAPNGGDGRAAGAGRGAAARRGCGARSMTELYLAWMMRVLVLGLVALGGLLILGHFGALDGFSQLGSGLLGIALGIACVVGATVWVLRLGLGR